MNSDFEEFVQALKHYVEGEIRGIDAEYIQTAIKVLDARNHIFVNIGPARTDEAEDIYAIRDLCHVNDYMETEVDENRIMGLARNYF